MKYSAPYAPKTYRSNAKLEKNPPPLPKGGYNKEGRKAKGILKIFIVLFLLVGANTIFQHFTGMHPLEQWFPKSSSLKERDAKSPIAKSGQLDDKNFLEPNQRDMVKEKVIKISDELARRVANHSHLPPSRGVNWAWIEENQATNQKAMDELLEKLSIEIGSSEALGVLRTIRENRASITNYQIMTQSTDPEIAKSASDKVTALKEEINLLTQKLRESYDKEGISLTEAQVRSITTSPHGEEASYLINGFQNIKLVCFEMENRLRKFPSEEMAKKYYGTYHVLLLALDRIQKNTIDRIYYLHLRETRWVLEEAQASKRKALDMLKNENSSTNLTSNQKRALQFNVQSYDRTITSAMNTERKLRQSLDSLVKNNDKLKYSIDAAQNSHTAMLLHTEISRIGQDHIKEIDQLKDITLPDMIAADFSDNNDPWLSPMTSQEYNP
jgi:hypothetical protein